MTNNTLKLLSLVALLSCFVSSAEGDTVSRGPATDIDPIDEGSVSGTSGPINPLGILKNPIEVSYDGYGASDAGTKEVVGKELGLEKEAEIGAEAGAGEVTVTHGDSEAYGIGVAAGGASNNSTIAGGTGIAVGVHDSANGKDSTTFIGMGGGIGGERENSGVGDAGGAGAGSVLLIEFLRKLKT